jgi:DNA-binding CsgD family transcriptional regulator
VELNRLLTLTLREREIFYLLMDSLKANEIALRLSLTISGVNYHVKKIYKKMKVNSKAELILKYYELRNIGKSQEDT